MYDYHDDVRNCVWDLYSASVHHRHIEEVADLYPRRFIEVTDQHFIQVSSYSMQ